MELIYQIFLNFDILKELSVVNIPEIENQTSSSLKKIQDILVNKKDPNYHPELINEKLGSFNDIRKEFIEHFELINIKELKYFNKLKKAGFYNDEDDKINDSQFLEFMKIWPSVIKGLFIGLHILLQSKYSENV